MTYNPRKLAGHFLHRLSVRLLGYNTTTYGRGYSDGWKARASWEPDQDTVWAEIGEIPNA